MVEAPPEPTPRERLLSLHEELCGDAKKIMRKKNQDYGKAQDPWFNFRRHGAYGIVVRLDDKLSRMNIFLENGALENESFRDSVLDSINYLVLLYGLLREEGRLKDQV